MTKLRFTIGPVQDFVRQSRRTRDLWASSFLLSYLSGVALHGAVRGDQKRIVLPRVEKDDLFGFIAGHRREPPTVGSLPNRFEIETDDPEADASAAGAALERAWTKIHQAVWNEYVAKIAGHGQETKSIFERQVEHFWEIQWVAGEDDAALKGMLEARKAWRSRLPTLEPGDKCLVMPQFQELSGWERAQERTKQDHFWEQLKSKNALRDFELRENERLCALALVKRLYPKMKTLFPEGFEGIKNWRSTVYVGAIPWINEVLEKKPDETLAYVQALTAKAPHITHEKPHEKTRPAQFAFLDANYFHVDAVKNPKATFTDERSAVDSKERAEFQKQLKGLYGQQEKDPIGPPASFYALLLMDGDRVGNLLAERGGTYVSESLARFTDQVQGIVDKHWGSTVYAGGDDVLAMVPVPNVLECAWELRAAYQGAFAGNPNATTSAGIVLAHIRRPLLEVLDEAHRLLDDVAKDKNGRDSLAISLLRSGDRALEWTSTWDEEKGQSRLIEITALEEMWRGKAKRKQDDDTALISGEMSTGLVYRLRETMGLLCGFPRWEPGICRTSAAIDAEAFFAADIRRMLRAAGLETENEQANQEEAKKMAARLLRLVHPIHRKEEIGKPPEIVRETSRMGLDGLLLALFLATDGQERDHGVMEDWT